MATKVSKAGPVKPERGPGALPVQVQRVEIRGVRIFEHLEFEVSARAPDEGQWIVLLGENGTGKTTLLRAIALALSRADTAIYAHTPIDAVHAFLNGPGSSVRVVADAGEYSFANTVTRTGPLLDLSGKPYVPVFGYGAARGSGQSLLAHGADDLRPVDALGTLFEPRRAGLVSTSGWLRTVALDAAQSESHAAFYEAVKSTIGSLLPGGEQVELDGSEVRIVSRAGERLPLAAQSEGYLTTIGWAVDLVARWAEMFRDRGKLDGNFAKDMPCVVLVDEIDLHLHPRWQLDIIPRLRKAFPKTTFIVTTHNPLTLQGARPGEVFVLQKDEAGKATIVQRDIVPGLDANALLTGDWFGLASTLDEDTLRLMDRHRKLLWAKKPDDDPERLALEATLRDRLGHFADTSLERLAQSVAVEVLHRENQDRPRDITEADHEEIVEKVLAHRADRDAASTARERGKTYRSGAGRKASPPAIGRARPKLPRSGKRR